VDASLPPLPAGPSRAPIHGRWREERQYENEKSRKPNAFARVLSGVFGAVGLTNRRASIALRKLGQVLETSAERAESFSRVVHAAGWRGPVTTMTKPVIEQKRVETPFMCNANASHVPIIRKKTRVKKISTTKKRNVEKNRSSVLWRFLVLTFQQQLNSWWKACALFLAGRWWSCRSSRRWSKLLAVIILTLLIANEWKLSSNPQKTSYYRQKNQRLARHNSPWTKRHDTKRSKEYPWSITTEWFEYMVRSLWKGSNLVSPNPNSGLGAYLSVRASTVLEDALSRGLASLAQVANANVDFGLEPPRLRWVHRLTKIPSALRAALASRGADPTRVVAFEFEIDDWQFIPEKEQGAFITADLLLKTSFKYAVPQLGLVLKDAVLSASRCIAAIEFLSEYPFVRYAALSFIVPPQLTTTSFVGSTSVSSDLLSFDPFASIIHDELSRALPTPPRALHFDLGAWLTYCSVPWQNVPWPNLERKMLIDNLTNTSFLQTPDNKIQAYSPQQEEAKSMANEERGSPLARVRRWIDRRRSSKKHEKFNKPQEESTLAYQEEAARKRLEDERKKLLDAATAVRRERDRLVAAARSTRQALSDRVIVAVKLQLAQELSSLASVLRNNKTPHSDLDDDKKNEQLSRKRFRIRHRGLVRDRVGSGGINIKENNNV